MDDEHAGDGMTRRRPPAVREDPDRGWLARLTGRRGPSEDLLHEVRGRDALAVLDASPDVLLVLDVAGRVAVAGPAAARLLGRDLDEVLGRPFDLLLHPDSRAVAALRVRWLVDDAASHLVVDLDDVLALREDGTTVPVSVRMSRIPTRRGPALCVTLRDRSAEHAARRDLERAERHARELQTTVAAMLRAVGDRAIIVLDAQGRMTALNRTTEKMLGHRADELLGRAFSVLSDPDDLASAAAELGLDTGPDGCLDPLLEVTRSGLPNALDWTFVGQAGERIIVSLRIVPIGAARDPHGFVCVAQQELSLGWLPGGSADTSAGAADRLLLALDDAPTRTLRWQFRGGAAAQSRRR